MSASFSPARRTPRFAPKKPVTIALSHRGVPTAYGVVTNLSEGGACFQTHVVPRQRELEMMMSFASGAYVQATGRVVWSELGDGLATVGVEFTGLSGEARKSLSDNLTRPEFAPL